ALAVFRFTMNSIAGLAPRRILLRRLRCACKCSGSLAHKTYRNSFLTRPICTLLLINCVVAPSSLPWPSEKRNAPLKGYIQRQRLRLYFFRLSRPATCLPKALTSLLGSISIQGGKYHV